MISENVKNLVIICISFGKKRNEKKTLCISFGKKKKCAFHLEKKRNEKKTLCISFGKKGNEMITLCISFGKKGKKRKPLNSKMMHNY